MTWKDFKNTPGKLNSKYTFLLWGKKVGDNINNLYEKLKKINKIIKDSYKRKKANDIIFNFIQYLEDCNVEDVINSLFFVDENILEFKLTKKELQICKEWNIPNFIMKYNDKFEIKYFNELFNDLEYTNVLLFNKNKLNHYHFNPTKIKLIEKIEINSLESIDTYIKQLEPGVIHGNSSFIKKIKNNDWIIFTKSLHEEKLLEIMLENQALKSHKKLQTEVFDNLLNPKYENMFVFGKKDISKAINNCMLKELYITKKLKNILEKNFSSDKLNFTIHQIIKIKSGDAADILIKNYDGLIGVFYYPQILS